MNARPTLALLASALLLAGCHQVPVTGRRAMNLVDEKEVTKMSVGMFEDLKKRYRPSRNQAQQQQLQRVGGRLAKVVFWDMPDADWEFVVFDNPQINAFAMAGGKVGVFTGIFRIAKNDDQLAAVLAHEIGHYRRGHIPKLIAVYAVTMLAAFAAIAWLANSNWFNPAFGFPPAQLAPSFLLFGLLSGVVTFWFSPLSNLLSRRHEYEADAFAREAVGGPGPMIAALRKLAQKNLTNLTPHPWYSGFHYSHPTLVERERALLEAPAKA